MYKVTYRIKYQGHREPKVEERTEDVTDVQLVELYDSENVEVHTVISHDELEANRRRHIMMVALTSYRDTVQECLSDSQVGLAERDEFEEILALTNQMIEELRD